MKWLCFFSALAIISACQKGPGEGGTSTIMGKVFVMNYNSSGQFVDSFYAQDEHVYIIYGDEAYFGDDIKTSYDGTYEFPFLRKGPYSVFAYSRCDTCAAGQQAVLITTEISKNHSVVILPRLVINK